MNIDEYAKYDALGLAELVSGRHVAPKELAETAVRAIEAINPAINAIVETYPARIESLDEKILGDGPFRGVPFLMKDVFGHEAGRKIEFGSRLRSDCIVCDCVAPITAPIELNPCAPRSPATTTPFRHRRAAPSSPKSGAPARRTG